MKNKLLGILLIACGVAVMAGAIAVELAWLSLCFGTVVIGLLLLLFAAPILITPLMWGLSAGVGLCAAGLNLFVSD